jgi:phosphatidate cytidylyltransferase
LNNFFRRTLTGAWIVIFILGGFWLHPISFLITGLVLLIGTQSEYYNIISATGVNPNRIAGLSAGIAVYILSVLVAAGLMPVRSYLFLIPLITLILILELYTVQPRHFDSIAHTFFPLLYTVMPFSLFPFAAFYRQGLDSLLPHAGIIFSPGIIIGFFLLIWANDTGAYLTGISFGRTRLMERISPKKTWEGFFGGIGTAVLVAWLLSHWLGVINTAEWIAVAVIVSVAGTYGDLIESMLKRSAGVKDSGSIMPGHGGFLDRFDSTLISFPLVYLFISLFG